MLAVPCTDCGAPSRVSLETPDVVACEKCGRKGPPPDDAKKRIAEAATVLEASDARARQLHGAMRGLASGAALRWYVGFVGVTAAWSAFCVAQWQPAAIVKSGGSAVLPTAGALMSFLVALPALVSMRRKARFVREMTSAVPPLRPGEPAACRVCGAPVAGAGGVIRCGHCGADNVVDASVLARAGEQQEHATRDLAADVASHAGEIGEWKKQGLIWTVCLSAFAVPFVTTIAGDEALDRFRFPLFSGKTYSTAPSYQGTCLSAREGGGVPGSWVVGKIHRNWYLGYGRVSGVAWHPFYGEIAIVEARSGQRIVHLDGICVVEPEAIQPEPAWPR